MAERHNYLGHPNAGPDAGYGAVLDVQNQSRHLHPLRNRDGQRTKDDFPEAGGNRSRHHHPLPGSLHGPCGNGRDRQYSRGSRGHQRRRPWCHFLDVDLRCSRYGHKICGNHSGARLPRKKRAGQLCGRSDVLHQQRPWPAV
ncbi:hypothetical protein SAMN05216375_1519 [Trichococcus ilyis]|uniref:Uncharacterized protein n=1 Tax=Trichococcus ilyis TaxID=640938 RepID=A0A143ZAQ8_9LACT|nr:Hypothetical protein TR210_2941 [Trichococcus ilyis]SEJ97342.1 hypothetical protein SAMN05216375_1519 [Trichococcus ilyis]